VLKPAYRNIANYTCKDFSGSMWFTIFFDRLKEESDESTLDL